MATFQFRACPDNSETPWQICVLCNDTVVVESTSINKPTTITYTFDDDVEKYHGIVIQVSGKRDQDTTVDEQGNIVRDSLLEFSDFMLDDIDISQLVYNKSKYLHDLNGHSKPVEQQFFGKAGCNGQIHFEFRSSIYVWLLEEM